jgi:excisionase family DNA binding protein
MHVAPLAYSVSDACKVSGLGRTTLYAAMKAGKLTAHKCGRRTVIMSDDLLAWLRTLPKPQEVGRRPCEVANKH